MISLGTTLVGGGAGATSSSSTSASPSSATTTRTSASSSSSSSRAPNRKTDSTAAPPTNAKTSYRTPTSTSTSAPDSDPPKPPIPISTRRYRKLKRTMPQLKRNAACVKCRRRRIKCDAAKPHCSSCVRSFSFLNRTQPDRVSEEKGVGCSYEEEEEEDMDGDVNMSMQTGEAEERLPGPAARDMEDDKSEDSGDMIGNENSMTSVEPGNRGHASAIRESEAAETRVKVLQDQVAELQNLLRSNRELSDGQPLSTSHGNAGNVSPPSISVNHSVGHRHDYAGSTTSAFDSTRQNHDLQYDRANVKQGSSTTESDFASWSTNTHIHTTNTDVPPVDMRKTVKIKPKTNESTSHSKLGAHSHSHSHPYRPTHYTPSSSAAGSAKGVSSSNSANSEAPRRSSHISIPPAHSANANANANASANGDGNSNFTTQPISAAPPTDSKEISPFLRNVQNGLITPNLEDIQRAAQYDPLDNVAYPTLPQGLDREAGRLGGSYLDLFWPGWPPELPTPAMMEHLAITFFDMMPWLSSMLDRKHLMARLALGPSGQNFPHTCLLHAICAVAARHTGAVHNQNVANSILATDAAMRDDGFPQTRNASASDIEEISKSACFSERNYRYARRLLNIENVHGRRLLEVVQASTLLVAYCHQEARLVAAWQLGGWTIRGAILAGLMRDPSEDILRRGYSLLPPATEAWDREERRRTMWTIFSFDVALSSCSGWPHMLQMDELYTKLPTARAGEDEVEVDIDTRAQTIRSPTLYTSHPIECSRSLMIKALNLLGRTNKFIRYVKTVDDSERAKLRDGSEFKTLDQDIAIFRSNFPPAMRNPLQTDTEEIDSGMVTAHFLPHVTAILLHEPFADLSDRHNVSAARLAVESRACLSIIYAVMSKCRDLSRILIPATSCDYCFTAARALVHFYQHAKASGDNTSAQILRGDLEVFVNAFRSLGNRFALAIRHWGMLETMVRRVDEEHIAQTGSKVHLEEHACPHKAILSEASDPSRRDSTLSTGASGAHPHPVPSDVSGTRSTVQAVPTPPEAADVHWNLMTMMMDPNYNMENTAGFQYQHLAQATPLTIPHYPFTSTTSTSAMHSPLPVPAPVASRTGTLAGGVDYFNFASITPNASDGGDARNGNGNGNGHGNANGGSSGSTSNSSGSVSLPSPGLPVQLQRMDIGVAAAAKQSGSTATYDVGNQYEYGGTAGARHVYPSGYVQAHTQGQGQQIPSYLSVDVNGNTVTNRQYDESDGFDWSSWIVNPNMGNALTPTPNNNANDVRG